MKWSAVSCRAFVSIWFAVLVGCAGCAATDAVVTTTYVRDEFDSAFAALREAACRALPDSQQQDREHVGALLRMPSGRFALSHGAAPRHRDTVTFSIVRPQASQVVAYWHTHGADGPGRGWFSALDVQLARDTGVPFFLITNDGDLRMVSASQEGDTPRRQRGSALQIPSGARGGQLVGSVTACAALPAALEVVHAARVDQVLASALVSHGNTNASATLAQAYIEQPASGGLVLGSLALGVDGGVEGGE